MKNSVIFINGKVWQEDGSFKEAFGIRNNKFDFIGIKNEANRIQSNYDSIIDLKGKTVLPGLIDSHVHLVYGSLMIKRIDCRKIKSFDELKQLLKNRIDSGTNNSDWLIGGNLNINSLNLDFEYDNPLDIISKTIPIFLINYDYHSAIANSAAIQSTGLFTKLTDFTEEEIPKNKKNKPAGYLKERAMKHIFNNMPEPSLQTKVDAVYEFIKTMHSLGITGICDIILTEDIEVYKELHKQGKNKIRISAYLPIYKSNKIDEYLNQTKELSKDFFEIKGFKIFYDGSLGSATAYFKENYRNLNHNGLQTEIVKNGKLPELFRKLDNNGWQLITHAIGDKAVSETLTLYENLINTNGKKDRRLRIEHAQHIDEADFSRFISSNTIVSAQPKHLKYDAELVYKYLPESIIKRTHNYKKLIDTDVKVCFGTDFPIVDINPFENIQISLTRKINNKLFFPENKIDLHNCIKCYTTNGAYASFNENNYGSIEEGKKADFIIINEDIFTMDEDEIGKIKVKETYIDGERVY